MKIDIGTIEQFKKTLLANEALRWVGITEAGTNSGQIVQMFQRWVDKRATREPWCMCFVQYCVGQIDLLVDEILRSSTFPTHIYKTEHVLTCWNKTPKIARLEKPEIGSLMIWNKEGTASGHTGIVVGLDGDKITTVEGNTGPSRSNKRVIRQGDGVYLKTRNYIGVSTMKVKGWINPWRI